MLPTQISPTSFTQLSLERAGSLANINRSRASSAVSSPREINVFPTDHSGLILGSRFRTDSVAVSSSALDAAEHASAPRADTSSADATSGLTGIRRGLTKVLEAASAAPRLDKIADEEQKQVAQMTQVSAETIQGFVASSPFAAAYSNASALPSQSLLR